MKKKTLITIAIIIAIAFGAKVTRTGSPEPQVGTTGGTPHNSEVEAPSAPTEATAPAATAADAAADITCLNLDSAALMLDQPPTQLLRRKSYTVSYNADTRQANWVAWRLTAEHTRGDVARPQGAFHEDTEVPRPRAHFEDYRDSPMSRGHLCPAGDNKWDAEAMYETFLMTNVSPQHRSFNAGEWNEIEKLCRTWARRYGAVAIVTGPLFANEPQRIGRARVAVPSAFFKAVVRGGSSPAAIAFVLANDDSNRPWRSCAMSVDELERRHHLDLFPTLPDTLEQRIEATHAVSQW